MGTTSIKKAVLINSIAKYSNVIIQLVINSILARLLTPKDFGIVAVIMVFISFFNILADMGIGPAIIQNKELDDKNISDIFLFTIFSAIAMSIAFALFSYGIAAFYDDSIYIKLGRLLSLSVFFNIANIVPNSLMLKQKEFKTIGMTAVSVNVIVGSITIMLAMKGASYYALIINSIITNLLLFSINFRNSKIKIYFNYRRESIKLIRSYSMYQFGFNFINYFSRNLDNILIGKFIGKESLGFYDKAYKLMLYPLQNLTFVITPVLHPILSEHQNDKEIIYNYFIKVIKILSLIGIYAGVICYFCSNEIIRILYGKGWDNSIPAFKILSISIWVQIISSCSGSIFQAAGRTKELFKCGVVTSICTVTGILLGVSTKNIEYVSIGVVTAFFINFGVICYILVYGVFQKSIMNFIKNLYSSIIIAGLMIFVLSIIQIKIENSLISVLIKGVIGTIVYLIGLFITKEYIFIKHVLRRKNE